MLTLLAILLFIPSQIFWLWQVRALGQKVHSQRVRAALVRLVGAGIYMALVAFNLRYGQAPSLNQPT